jgi:hypothetical protein
MQDAIGSLMRRAALAACLTLTLTPVAHAQEPLAGEPPTSAEFMSRFDFHMSAAGLQDPDRRFSWDTHWGGDFDFLDYTHGRMMFLADYQVFLGDELRMFDPNQSLYTLAVSGSVRVKGTELAGVLHHVSRHLSDRPNREAIAFNALELRLLRHVNFGRESLDIRVEGGPVIARAFVDYLFMGVFDSTFRRQMSPRTGVYGRIYSDYYVVDPDVAGRHNQAGARFEGGLRLTGKGGALDLFGGYEQVVDAYPLDRQSRQWAFAGFRLVN